MEVHAYRTAVVNPNDSLTKILKDSLPVLRENDIVAVTSKIAGLCEGRVVKIEDGINKTDLIKKEAEYYIDDPRMGKYNILLTIKNSSLVASAGIDESNGNGYYVYWPENPDRSTEEIWHYLRREYSLKNLGVILTDSKTTPLRWGVTAFSISWCGFAPLKSYVGTPDIYGRPFKFEQTSIIDSLATAAAFVMGEGAEQTPLAVIRNVPHVEFMNRVPSNEERKQFEILLADDIYAPLTNSPHWQKGGNGK